MFVLLSASLCCGKDEVLRAAQTEFDQATLDVEQLEQQIAAAEAGIAQHEHTLAEKTSASLPPLPSLCHKELFVSLRRRSCVWTKH